MTGSFSSLLPLMEMPTLICWAHMLVSSRGPHGSANLERCDFSPASHSACVTNSEGQADPFGFSRCPAQ